MTSTEQTESYTPQPGERVTVRRYRQDTLTPGRWDRTLTFEFTATLAEARPDSAGVSYYFDPATVEITFDCRGDRIPEHLAMIHTGYVTLPGTPVQYLLTEVGPAPATVTFRRELAPGLHLAVDPSSCIVLEVSNLRTGLTVQRRTVTDVDAFKAYLDQARDFQNINEALAEQRRRETLTG